MRACARTVTVFLRPTTPSLGIWLLAGCPAAESTSTGEPGGSETGAREPTTSPSNLPTTSSPDDATTAPATSTGEGPDGEETTAASPPICGDAHLDPGEECDLGFANNDDSGACTHLCRLAFCGDDLVQVGVEECDAGPDSNDSLYNGCTSRCVKGPHCGDHVVQAPEECDAGPLNGTERLGEGASVPCSEGCRYEARLAFVTSVPYNGALNGIAGADKLCEAHAEAGALDNPEGFRAWLSTGDKPVGPSFLAAEPASPLPFVLPSGELVAADVDGLLDDGPLVALVTDEHGEPLGEGVRVWTNTGVDGSYLYADKHCDAWTKLEGTTRIGLSAPPDGMTFEDWADGTWTSSSDRGCYDDAHLYCFEIDGP